jgi:uncharacterized membrane protein YkoI
MSVKFAITAGAILFATAAFAAKPAQHVAPKISRAAATKTALAAVPGGSVKSMHMENERGRSVYSFDIAAPKKPGVEEVQVSALDGKIVSRTHESPAKERAEMAHKAHK